MGGFHAICIFTAVIGKRFASAGLRDIIIEANLVGSGAVEQVLKGKSYNRTVKILKIVYEALQRLKLDEFKNWLYENSDIANLTCALESYEFSETCRYRNNENAVQTTAKIDPLFDLWVQYENDLQSDKIGPMSEFWNSFLTMVDIMLDYIKSIRLADWNLHLQSMERMLKWFHAYDHTNYARHFTYCWADQQNLSEKHPMIYEEFINGNFSVQRTKGKFNMLPPDQVIEQTINKEQKGPGGIIGFSTSPGTVQRWVLSSHVLANVSTDFKQKLGLDTPQVVPKDLGKKRKIHIETCVANCYEIIKSWNNPFEQSKTLSSLSSGIEAPIDVQNDIMNAADIDDTQAKTFISSRIESGVTGFHDPIKKNKLKTFCSLSKKR